MNKTTPLVVFNKPYGVVCQFSPHERHPSLKAFIPVPNIYPAGRLDTDSEGLLLLTADGALQARISNPKHKTVKTYWVQLEGTLDTNKLAQLQQPMNLNGFQTQAAQIRLLSESETTQLWARTPPVRFRKTVPDFWLEIRISEGKNRQVRRMCAKAGYPCLRLVRVGVGCLNIFELGLEAGTWQYCNTLP